MVVDLPLTGHSELKHVLPEAYEELGSGGTRTAAEAAFLETALPG